MPQLVNKLQQLDAPQPANDAVPPIEKTSASKGAQEAVKAHRPCDQQLEKLDNGQPYDITTMQDKQPKTIIDVSSKRTLISAH